MMDLPKNIVRTSVNFMGCYAAVHGLKLADAFCSSNKAANVLVVCTELCTLHFQKEHTVDNITQYMSILYDKLTRREIINEGIKNASQFSWDNTYSHLISVYEEALNINK